MSYSKNTWQTGDTVTAELLNHMEDGISSADAKELPSYGTSDKKKCLMINSSGNGLEWGTEVPNYDSSFTKKRMLSTNDAGAALTWRFIPTDVTWYADSTNDGSGETQLYKNTNMSYTTLTNKATTSDYSSAGVNYIGPAGVPGNNFCIMDLKYIVSGEFYEKMRPITICEDNGIIKFLCMDHNGTTHVYKTDES